MLLSLISLVALAEPPCAHDVAALRLGTEVICREELGDRPGQTALGLALGKLTAPLVEAKGLAPTEAELASYQRFSERMDQELVDRWREEIAALERGPQTPERVAERQQLEETLSGYEAWAADPALAAEREQQARREVQRWKIDRYLYETYGGDVIFQQFNPWEPVGAYQAFLEAEQARGGLEILDPTLVEPFWRYFRIGHNVLPGPVDLSLPPWER